MSSRDAARIIEALHQKYASVLYYQAMRMLGDPQEAEDAVQETFLSAYRALHRFNGGDNYLPWLYRIATNVCLKVIRSRNKKGAIPDEALDEEKAPNLCEVSRLHFKGILDRVGGSLDQRDKEILILHFLDGLTQEDVAGALGISRRAVVKRLTAIRKRLGGLLEDHDE